MSDVGLGQGQGGRHVHRSWTMGLQSNDEGGRPRASVTKIGICPERGWFVWVTYTETMRTRDPASRSDGWFMTPHMNVSYRNSPCPVEGQDGAIVAAAKRRRQEGGQQGQAGDEKEEDEEQGATQQEGVGPALRGGG